MFYAQIAFPSSIDENAAFFLFPIICVSYNLKKKVFGRCMKNINHHPSSTMYPSLGFLVVNMYNLDAAVKQSDVHIIRPIDLGYI